MAVRAEREAEPGGSPVPLESVLCTEELHRRPSRPPDFETENRALATLAKALADSPDTILQTLADTILDVFQVDSAGLSLLTTHDGGKRFYWPAIAGAWKPHVGGGTPREFGPCGDVLDCNAPLLFKHFERRYPYLLPATPAAEEALLIPFSVNGKAVGTIWAMAHDDRRRFDAEDLRQLESLGRFAAAAYHAVKLRQVNDSQRAALNLMEDAVHARGVVEKLNVELRESEGRYRAFTGQVMDYAIFRTDVQGRALTWNRGVKNVLGFDEEDFIGRDIVETIFTPEDVASGVAERELEIAAANGTAGNDRWMRRKDGERFFANGVTTALTNDGGELIGYTKVMRDMTERKLAESLIQCQKESLELVVKGEPLERVLDFLARSMESQSQGRFLAAVHLMEADGYHFGYVAAPSLPARYAEATKGMDARLELGTCSSAVMSHTPTIVRDFAAETRWPAFSAEVISMGLRACFTTPIASLSNGHSGADPKIMGTFAIYYREPGDPSPRDRQLVDFVTSTVALAIERERDQEALRTSEERFRTLADNMAQLAWTCDALGNVTWYNQRWLDYTGKTFEDMQGWGWKSVHHPDHVDRVVEGVRRSGEAGEVWEDTFPLRGAGGSYCWFLSRAVPIRDDAGKVLRWFGTNTDITEQREMAEALRQNAADMSETDRRKNEFLAMLAHELRNPLAPLHSALHILRLKGGDPAAVQSASEMMERQVGQLVRLVDDLLDSSRISRGTIELRRSRIELASVIHRAAEGVGVLCERMDQQLTVAVPPQPIYLDADPARLAQVVGNLLNNACKFTDKGGRIALTTEREGAHALIRVSDNGIGIAAGELTRIFDMFTQVDTSLERSAGGLGIGLTLVKNVVDLHGGTVEARSAGLGQGSELIVRLPIVVDAPESQPQAGASESSPSARRILVVDDNRDAALSLAMLLQLTGHEVHTAHDGLEGLEAATRLGPDVILLDIGLPGLNGYEVGRRIRGEPWGKDIVLVALTGWGQEEDRKKSRDAGFDAHLVKPVDHAALTKLLAEMAGES